MYNYWPHPISQHPLYTTWFRDDVTMSLARKDQATWNVLALIDDSLHTYPIGQGIPAYTNLAEVQKIYGSHFKRVYLSLDRLYGSGVTLRHQALNLSPRKLLEWVESEGGWATVLVHETPTSGITGQTLPMHLQALKLLDELCAEYTKNAEQLIEQVEKDAHVT